MPLSTDISDIEQGCDAKLSFDCELIFLGIGQNIFVIESWGRSDWYVLAPVNRSVRIFSREIVRRRRSWESLSFDMACPAIDKWRSEFRRRRTAVIIAK